VRTSTGFLLASGLLVSVALTGCTSTASCDPTWSAGGLAGTVEVTGGFGGEVAVTFPTPLVQRSASTAIADAGEGPVVRDGQFVNAVVTIIDATSGERIDGGRLTQLVNDTEPRLTTAVECAPVGSRVVAVGPASELIGTEYITTNNLGFAPTDTLVYVIDVVEAYLGRADGADRLPQNGLPTISLAPDGRPGFTFTNAAPPADLRVSVLKEGTGATVDEGDTVVMHYTGVSWETRTVFDTTWESGTPAALVAADGTTTEGGVVPGFAQALIGQKVGSQVLVSIPADLAYPEGSSTAVAGQPLLFVFDILGIQGSD
jgi:peptidylprolyl isomerase